MSDDSSAPATTSTFTSDTTSTYPSHASNTNTTSYTVTTSPHNSLHAHPVQVNFNGMQYTPPMSGVPTNISIRLNATGEVEHYSYSSTMGDFIYTTQGAHNGQASATPYTQSHIENSSEDDGYDSYRKTHSTSPSYPETAHKQYSGKEDRPASEPLLQQQPKPMTTPQYEKVTKSTYKSGRPEEGYCCYCWTKFDMCVDKWIDYCWTIFCWRGHMCKICEACINGCSGA